MYLVTSSRHDPVISQDLVASIRDLSVINSGTSMLNYDEAYDIGSSGCNKGHYGSNNEEAFMHINPQKGPTVKAFSPSKSSIING